MCKNLPCEECTKTNNHCCLADVPHAITDAIYYKYLANKLGIECLIVPHPSGVEHMYVLVDESMRGQDIQKRNCIFLKNGKCVIYDNRPTICRAYGTECMPCRYENTDLKTVSDIASLTRNDIEKLDKRTNIPELFDKIMENEL